MYGNNNTQGTVRVMNTRITKKILRRIGLLYGILISVINFMGFLVVSNQSMPVLQSEELGHWMNFIETHNGLINLMSVASFSIPILVCLYYVFVVDEHSIEGRLINISEVYALIGCSGWMISFVFETIFLIYVHFMDDLSMHSVAMSSFLNIVQCCVFIGTLSFMCLNSIQRLYVFPKYFPDGNLSKYQGYRKTSIGLIFTILYLSVGIFPIFYLISTIRNYSIGLGFEVEHSVYYFMLGVVVLGCVLMTTVAYYFSIPLKRLKRATENIKEGQYDQLVDVVSNDDFGDLSDNFNSMTRSLDDKSQRIVKIQNSIIRGMAVMVESRDNSTGGHINRTSECVKVFVKKMKQEERFKITDSFEQAIIKAAPMHDLGKIAVDDEILRKPGRFTDEEFEKMKKHAEEGAKIVAEVLRESDDEEFKKIAVNVANFHHEKWNGTGYPTKISGTDIPYEARIMALADVFDALVSKRCYKESMGFDQAFSIIEESLGQHFDPELGAFFISCRPELEELYSILPE